MLQSVELLLDLALDTAVREQWQALVTAGLPSQARHSGSSNAPHITLALSDSALPQPVEDALASAVTLPLPVRLGGLLLFGDGPYILVRAVVPSRPLLDVHDAVARLLEETSTQEHTHPGHWSPHVTLAHRLDRDAVPAALTALGPVSDLTGHAVAARRWDADRQQDWLIAGGAT